MKRREVVVIGGGVAGSAAAIRLAQNGQDVLLLEKEPAAHDKVCGEFIAADAQHYLRELGIDLAALDAERITGIRITRGQRTSSARLPFSALSLSRRVLDEALLVRAQDQGARVWRGAAVTALIKGPECWHIEVAGHGVIQAETIFLATGKHDLREWRRPRGTQNDFLGFKCHFLLTPTQRVALAEHVEMTLFNGGYAGLGLVESGKANLCLVVTRRHFAMYGKKWDGLLGAILKAAPLLAERLAGAEACWPRPLSIFGIPYGFVYRVPSKTSPGLYRLGDQMAVIPSFSGYGMSIALHTAFLAAECHLRGGNANVYHRQARSDLLPLVRSASLLSKMAEFPWAQRGMLFASQIRPELITMIARQNRISTLQATLRPVC
ncbi:MAG: FAD-dependent oxidoreductase [Terriglobales bacterium]|jgi:flavin-dependent dehydrogenase